MLSIGAGDIIQKPKEREMGCVENALRGEINQYFEAENAEPNLTDEDLPLKSAGPMLGADARALIVQLRQACTQASS